MDTNPFSQAFVDQILSGKASEAETSFRDIIAMKVNDTLNARKIEVASSLYGGDVPTPVVDAPIIDAAPSSSEPT